jgi:hypothetical protein
MNSSNKTEHAEKISGACELYLPQELTIIKGHQSLDQILKLTIISNIPPDKKITENGLQCEELKKGIELLKLEINNIIANNSNEQNNAEIELSQSQLSILENKYAECLSKGNFEQTTDYKEIAIKALQILANHDADSEKLYIMINKRFGIIMNKIMTKKDLWMKRWEEYEENLEYIVQNLSEKEQAEYEDYKKEKERAGRRNHYRYDNRNNTGNYQQRPNSDYRNDTGNYQQRPNSDYRYPRQPRENFKSFVTEEKK